MRACALRLGAGKPHATLMALLYFVEATIVGLFMRRGGLHHLHCHYSSTVGLLVRRMFPISLSMTLHGPAELVDSHTFHTKEKIAASAFVCAVSKHGERRLKANRFKRIRRNVLA